MASNFQLELGKVAEIRALLGDADPDLIHDCLDGETDIYLIMDWLIGKLGDEESMEEAIALRVKALGERKTACQGRQARLRGALHACLTATGERSLRRPEATLTIRPVKPSISDVDESVLPERFFKVTKAVSKSLINDALAAGELVPGVVMGNGSESLSVRRA